MIVLDFSSHEMSVGTFIAEGKYQNIENLGDINSPAFLEFAKYLCVLQLGCGGEYGVLNSITLVTEKGNTKLGMHRYKKYFEERISGFS